ncbi:unnamed protein product [Peniophora sp. CBMAI 1063]|nr:unnamed protein product [Peniophora sp. CBMAI 1063]
MPPGNPVNNQGYPSWPPGDQRRPADGQHHSYNDGYNSYAQMHGGQGHNHGGMFGSANPNELSMLESGPYAPTPDWPPNGSGYPRVDGSQYENGAPPFVSLSDTMRQGGSASGGLTPLATSPSLINAPSADQMSVDQLRQLLALKTWQAENSTTHPSLQASTPLRPPVSDFAPPAAPEIFNPIPVPHEQASAPFGSHSMHSTPTPGLAAPAPSTNMTGMSIPGPDTAPVESSTGPVRNSAAAKATNRQMYGGLGIVYTGRRKYPLPDLPPTESRKVPVQPTDVWTPNFAEDHNEPYNARYIDTMHNTLISNEAQQPADNRPYTDLGLELGRKRLIKVFSQMRKNKKEQGNKTLQDRVEVHNRAKMRERRRSRLADTLRDVADEVERDLNTYEGRPVGEPPVSGLRELIKTDYAPSCASDSGDVDQMEWDKRKTMYMAKYGVKQTKGAWELRPPSWYSPQLKKLYLLLIKKALARRQLDPKKKNTGPTFTFPGFSANMSKRLPDKAPWREAVISDWFDEQTRFAEDVLPHVPATLTALQAKIPASFFEDMDREWVADDELTDGEGVTDDADGEGTET